SVTEGAWPLKLAPTASTTAALALGDALAITLLVEKGFRLEDFASLHPAGRIGKRLMPIGQLMHSGKACPRVAADTPMRAVICEMTSKALGMTCVVGGDDVLMGIITDGDLRRHLDDTSDILQLTAGETMTRDPVTVPPTMLVVEALHIMESRK